ncbi:macrophage-expressed gene 1 protein-like [Antedon mediterranea]|uniref:macrophage-expressed gene 1 protein-like n=1 Tax=Antedon mediterranea TaxID=105859 RepID=UPI003AF8C56A
MDKSKFVCKVLIVLYVHLTTTVSGAEVDEIDGNSCKTDLKTLPVTGNGFDNLRNVDMGQVLLNSYKKCQTTNDKKYIVADDVTVIPIKHSQIDEIPELFEHWYNYTSTTSDFINAHVSLFSDISGMFSDENELVKTKQVYDKSSTTRVQVRHHLYKARTDNPILHPTFKSRVMNICANFQNNDTRMARYITQQLIRDYGTHVVTVVDVGGVYLQLDQIKNTFVNNLDSEKHIVKAAASFWFWKISAGGGFSSSSSQTMNEYYRTNRTYSKIETHGSDPYTEMLTQAEWQNSLPNNLVAIDKDGDPLHYMITTNTLPDIPEPTVTYVSNLIYEEIKRYYDVNTHKGCIDMDSANFDFGANTADGSCIAPYNSYIFGGVYQTCEMKPGSDAGDMCPSLSQKNPLTGDFTCQSGYEAVQLNTARLFTKHSGVSLLNPFQLILATVYTSTMPNLLTEAHRCPITFYSLRMGSDLFVCVNDDYDLGYRYSVPFAGFFSCSAGNPLSLQITHVSATFLDEGSAANWPQKCPSGYSQHLAAIDNDCRIDFCIKATALSGIGLPKIIRPPYNPKPTRNPNTTEPRYIVGTHSKVWVKNITSLKWRLTSVPPIDKAQTTKDTKGRNINMSMVFGVIIGVIVFVVIAILVAYKILTKKNAFNYQRINTFEY